MRIKSHELMILHLKLEWNIWWGNLNKTKWSAVLQNYVLFKKIPFWIVFQNQDLKWLLIIMISYKHPIPYPTFLARSNQNTCRYRVHWVFLLLCRGRGEQRAACVSHSIWGMWGDMWHYLITFTHNEMYIKVDQTTREINSREFPLRLSKFCDAPSPGCW